MRDSILVLIATHPFASCALPTALACILILFKKKTFLLLGSFAMFTSVIIGTILHFRWDSFSIHLSETKNIPSVSDHNVLFIGDSITCEGTRPRGFITKLVSFSNIGFSVFCQKGATTDRLIKLISDKQFDNHPTLIVVQSGINDLLLDCSVSETEYLQNSLCTKINSKFPKSRIWFLPIHPFSFNGRVFTAELSVKKSFPLWWDKNASFEDHFLTEDGIHLNALGHTVLAKALLDKLSTIDPRVI
jgi:hypothetical protein